MSGSIALPYLARPVPSRIILGTFLAITLPFSLYTLATGDFIQRHRGLLFLYIWILGGTHFALTLTIYLQSSNLRYFGSTWTNRIAYFFVPPLLLITFDLFRFLDLPRAVPGIAFLVFAAIRFLDFIHFTRQTYGVLSIFQSSAGPLPRWLRSVERLYFLGVTGLLLCAYLNGGRLAPASMAPHNREAVYGLMSATVAAFLLIAGALGRVWLASPRARVNALPVAYFLSQTLAACLAMVDISLYLFALAVHYVEYHVLMAPRCFAAPLDPAAPVDRFYGRLRARKVVFYGALALVAAWFTHRTWYSMLNILRDAETGGVAPIFIVVGFIDGLFIVHYFLEALIWRFSEPHYRENLGPLYFPRAPTAATQEA